MILVLNRFEDYYPRTIISPNAYGISPKHVPASKKTGPTFSSQQNHPRINKKKPTFPRDLGDVRQLDSNASQAALSNLTYQAPSDFEGFGLAKVPLAHL